MESPGSMRTTSNSSATTSNPGPPGNPRKTRSIRRLGEVDVSKLAKAVSAIPEEVWEAENAAKRNKFENLSTTRHIVFRFVRTYYDWRESVDMPIWEEWRPLVEPVLAGATAAYGYKRGGFPRIMLARMAPGGVIHPHHDNAPAAAWPHKIHVPLTTNPGVVFLQEGTPHHFPVGEAFEVNNLDEHGVENRGETDRIHLIFEYYDLDQPEPRWAPPLGGRPRAAQFAR
jgi:hypothetical protein